MGAAEQVDERIGGASETERAKTLRPLLGPGPLEPGLLGQSPQLEALRGLPARFLFELPLAPSLALHVPGVPGLIRVSATGEPEDDEAADHGEIGASEANDLWLDVDEWAALVVAVEADRVFEADFRAICQRKRAEPAFRLTPEQSLAGAQPDPAERWSLARILTRVGAEVISASL